MKVYDNNKESSYLKYWDDVNNLYNWVVLKNHPANNFERIDDLPFLPEKMNIENAKRLFC